MTNRYILATIFLLSIFCFRVYPQPDYLASTSWESTEIVVPKAGNVKRIIIMNDDSNRPPKDLQFSVASNSFHVSVDLGMGNNKFTLVTTFSDATPTSVIDIVIKRVALDSTVSPKKAANLPLNLTESAAVANQNSQIKTELPGVTILNAKDVITVASGPSALTSETSPSSASVESSVPTLNAQNTLPLPAPTPLSPTSRALDSENRSIPINPNYRLIFGFEQAGASSATSKGRPFADLFLSIPVGQLSVRYNKNGEATRRYFRNAFWTNFKLTSAPNQTLPDFGGLTSTAIGGFFGSNQSSKINDLAQAFEMKIGWETTLRPNLSAIAGVGATSPLSSETSVVAYKIPRLANGQVQPEFKRIFGPDQDFSGLENLILTSGDRDRFLRSWFAGLRLKHQFFADSPEKIKEVYPAVFELTVGQDEVMTNKLIGGVLKFDSFVPIPVKGLSFLYFGANFSSRLTRKVNTTTFPFFLEPATNINLFANNNFIRNIKDIRELNSDRDYFSFRFGVDLLQLLNRADKPKDALVPTQPKRTTF